MLQAESENSLFDLAVSYVNFSKQHVFVTGKAGTGKTTFLKFITKNTIKKTIVVAPTGVAAINAGGVTMHSMFQLPFAPFVASSNSIYETDRIGIKGLIANIRFNADKRQLLQELELLIIDEISMVRADMLDATDLILRHFRGKPNLPFGGVQVVYIGDMHQLPPVINNHEWKILSEHYEGPYFFDAHVVREYPPLFIELEKIYRQKDKHFIKILNNIRHNTCTEDDEEILTDYYKPNFVPEKDEHFITLTTHNSKADEINERELFKLSGNTYKYEAEISGDINEKSVIADKTLALKKGAQVMFLKNDPNKKYYNGKIGIVSSVSENEITVKCDNDDKEIKLEKEAWKNIRYEYNNATEKVEEKTLGTFTQFPIKLAWAITIHKSQGLTFEKAIIDAGSSFAPGQVYVALSRLTSLSGMVLLSKINLQNLHTDERLTEFSDKADSEKDLENNLQAAQLDYLSEFLYGTYDFNKINNLIKEHKTTYPFINIPEKPEAITWANILESYWEEESLVAEKFQKNLKQILDKKGENYLQFLYERNQAAQNYFDKKIDKILEFIGYHISKYVTKSRTKKYCREITDIYRKINQKKKHINNALEITKLMTEGVSVKKMLAQMSAVSTEEYELPEFEKAVKKKPQKGDSHLETLGYFKEGKTILEISDIRALARTTIEGHLASFVLNGTLNINELLPENRISEIAETIKNNDTKSFADIKAICGDKYSYSEIRFVVNHLNWIKNNN